ncbi:MAG: VanW family protein [bacterium]|nr:VanW family protein [bacterium]
MRTLLRLLPVPIRVQLKLILRYFSDMSKGISSKIAKSTGDIKTQSEFKIAQPVKKSHLYENKLHNLRLAANSIEKIVIKPGEIFSFWSAVGKPVERNGFRKGRNLVNGVLSEQVGGGLCQVASIIYHAGIQSNLKVRERFHHSVDIYEEHERFTPLGADATVVYGYKDLRLENIYPFDIQFQFDVQDEVINCSLVAEGELEIKEIVFEVEEIDKRREVKTKIKGEDRVLDIGTYSLIQ